MKYILLRLKTRDGEREYYHDSVHQLQYKTDIDKFADEHCKDFWGKADEKDKETGGYWFHGWEVHTSVYKTELISKQNYEILKQCL